MSSPGNRILIVDDDAVVAEALAELLAAHGYEPSVAGDANAALAELKRAASAPKHEEGASVSPQFAAVITDMAMPGRSGLELIREIVKRHPEVTPLAVTGYGTIGSAVEAVRAGAVDYLTKPLVDRELLTAVEKAVQQHVLRTENTVLRNRLSGRKMDDIIGSDPQMMKVYDIIEQVAPSQTTILMCGESGTGKSLIARAVHRRSPRRDNPFVEIACGSIPETLLESELFGHVKGAFTGAHADKTGRFLAAHTGTLFLDEINSASPGMQLKLLRVLQERRFEPVGSSKTIETDVRVILASNEPLERRVARGEFRQDLYYRINVVRIHLPPLRERPGDIPLLAEHFIAKYASEMNRRIAGFHDRAMQALLAYQYPGNVRELENIVQRAVVLSHSPTIDVADLPEYVRDPSHAHPLIDVDDSTPGRASQGEGDILHIEDLASLPLREALEEPERRIILAALNRCDWNRQKTAEQLGINRTTLYKKMRQFGLDELDKAG